MFATALARATAARSSGGSAAAATSMRSASRAASTSAAAASPTTIARPLTTLSRTASASASLRMVGNADPSRAARADAGSLSNS